MKKFESLKEKEQETFWIHVIIFSKWIILKAVMNHMKTKECPLYSAQEYSDHFVYSLTTIFRLYIWWIQ